MKLMFTIVQSEDVYDLTEALMDAEYSVTKLNSTGAFLGNSNITLMVGTEDEKVDDVISIIGKLCKSRKQIISAPFASHLSDTSVNGAYPLEVKVGGATVFVVDVDRFVKL